MSSLASGERPPLEDEEYAGDYVAERVRHSNRQSARNKTLKAGMQRWADDFPSSNAFCFIQSGLSNQVLTCFSAGPQLGVAPVADRLLKAVYRELTGAAVGRNRKLWTGAEEQGIVETFLEDAVQRGLMARQHVDLLIQKMCTGRVDAASQGQVQASLLLPH